MRFEKFGTFIYFGLVIERYFSINIFVTYSKIYFMLIFLMFLLNTENFSIVLILKISKSYNLIYRL